MRDSSLYHLSTKLRYFVLRVTCTSVPDQPVYLRSYLAPVSAADEAISLIWSADLSMLVSEKNTEPIRLTQNVRSRVPLKARRLLRFLRSRPRTVPARLLLP